MTGVMGWLPPQLPRCDIGDMLWGPPHVVAGARRVGIASSAMLRLPTQSIRPSLRHTTGSARRGARLSVCLFVQ